MNKYYVHSVLMTLFSSVSLTLCSQNVAINSTGNQADPSALVDMSSTTGGILIPRMNATQMNAIANPALGLQVFNTTTNCLMLYSGNAWQSVFCACTSAPSTPGTIAGSDTVCSGASGKIYSIVAISGANSYTWNVPIGASIIAGQGTSSITVTFNSSPGNITVTATNNCGTSAANTLPVAIKTIPTAVTVSASPNPVCAGTTLTLTGGASGATSWSWSGPNSFTSSTQNPSISGISTAGAGTYKLTASNVCGPAAPVNTASVTVTPAIPTAVTASASPSPVCAGSTLTLTGSASGATSLSWSGPNSFTSSSQNPAITNVTTAGTGVYTLTASNVCGSATATTAADTVEQIIATGGAVTYVNGQTIHTFTSNGVFNVTCGSGNVQVLVVGGGGGGGGYISGGGGGGGFIYNSSYAISPQAYSITVGAGGAAGTGSSQGSNGGNSVFDQITAAGGGGGGGGEGANASSGGSGGGAGRGGRNSQPGAGNTPPTTPSQGNNGGTGSNGSCSDNLGAGAGGGGAGAAGGNASGCTAGTGGAGTVSSISGSAVTYSGGGGGGAYQGTGGNGGAGGGGSGANGYGNFSVPGTTNTGGGGGAGGYPDNNNGSNGGSGIVIISY